MMAESLIGILVFENEQLKAENERLKEEIWNKKQNLGIILEECNRIKTQYNCYACGYCKGKEHYRNLEEHHLGLRKQFDKYKSCLQEIKEIVDDDLTVCLTCSERYTNDCNRFQDFDKEGDCTHCGAGARANLAKQILQKISDCEVEE